MNNFAIIVEGAHDASFLGQILKKRNFERIKKLSLVPDEWKKLFPKNFPTDGDNLERVMRFPEVFISNDLTIGILTSGSDSHITRTLRSVIDVMGLDSFSGIAIFIDIDNNKVEKRLDWIKNEIKAMNEGALEEDLPGYPITIPQAAGVMESGSPRVGIFLFPDNMKSGALENILIQCAQNNHPDITKKAISLVDDLDKDLPPNHAGVKFLRSGMGKEKAKVGIIANLLKPGASAAASLAQTEWIPNPYPPDSLIYKVDTFFDDFLK